MKAFEKWFKSKHCDYKTPCDPTDEATGCTNCEDLRAEGWRAALEWARIKLENYTPDDVAYFIEQELEANQ